MPSLRGPAADADDDLVDDERSSPVLAVVPHASTSDASRSRPVDLRRPSSTLMPRLVNARTTVWATCWSTPARICGSASRIVTSAPTSTRNDANSQPIAPPPTTATRAGTVVELEHVDRTRARARRRTRSRSTGERARRRTGRDEHVAAAHLGAVGDANGPAVGRERAGAGNDRDLAALEQRLEPARSGGRRPPACGPGCRTGRSSATTTARRTRPRSSTVR